MKINSFLIIFIYFVVLFYIYLIMGPTDLTVPFDMMGHIYNIIIQKMVMIFFF